MSAAVIEPSQPRLHARAMTRLVYNLLSHHFHGGMTPAERLEARKAAAYLSAMYLQGEGDEAVLAHYNDMIEAKAAIEQDGGLYLGCGVFVEPEEAAPKRTAAE